MPGLATHLLALSRTAWAIPRWLALPHCPRVGTVVPDFFVGIHAAGSPDAAAEEAVLARLASLPITPVKLDIQPANPAEHVIRFLERLSQGGFRVLLRLVPSPQEAAQLDHSSEIRQRWRDGIRAITQLPGWAAVEAVEIGNTVNRRKWSGFTLSSFAIAWGEAASILRPLGVKRIGPNVSDFEPSHLIAFLRAMRRHGGLPDIASVNLFVERARTPEAFDSRVAGVWMAPALRLNLHRKAAILHDIAIKAGVQGLWSTHTCWHRFRLERWSRDPELLRAAYLARYLLCAAASGVLERVYWGTLIGCPEGLVDDGQGPQPGLERVAYYDRVLGHADAWGDLPALAVLRFIAGLLPGSTLTSWDEKRDGLIHSAWRHPVCGTWNATWNACDAESPFSPEGHRVVNMLGEELFQAPSSVGGNPIFCFES